MAKGGIRMRSEREKFSQVRCHGVNNSLWRVRFHMVPGIILLCVWGKQTNKQKQPLLLDNLCSSVCSAIFLFKLSKLFKCYSAGFGIMKMLGN